MIDLENIISSQILGVNPKNEDKVLITIQVKNGGLWEKEYFKNDKIQNIIDDFKESNGEEFPIEYINNWKNKVESLKMTDVIEKLLLSNITSNIKERPEIILEEEIIPDIIGKPFSEPFEVFIFNRKDKKLNIQKYEDDEIDKYKLNDYNSSSAYCNGNNRLFISGGEKNNLNYNNKFWKINLDNQGIDFIEMEDKKNHSMIYIPGGYVFIVGGINKKTFCYDEQNNQIWLYGNLNILRNEPALVLISGLLYCFDNINIKDSSNKFTFERTDLNKESSEWELMAPNFNYKVNGMNQKFFGIVKNDGNNILFLGGNMDENEDKNKYNYSYNIKNNEIELSDIPFKEYNFKEKTFLPYNENIEYILPDFNRNHPEVIFYQKNKKKLNIVKYKHDSKNKSPININTCTQKFNFKMPTISIPNIGNDNIINNNEEIDIKIDKPKNDTKNLSRNININNEEKKITIDQPPQYKAPEIEINKCDMKISLNIPSNIFGNSSKEEDVIMNQNDIQKSNEINFENKDKIESQNLNIGIKGNFNNDDPKMELTQINSNNAKENGPDIPKLNLININNNKKINKKIQEIKVNRPDNINNNEQMSKLNNIVKSPDYYISGVIHGNNKGINTNKTKDNKDRIKSGINIKGEKMDSNARSEMNIKQTININNEYKKDVILKGLIPGTKSKNKSTGKINIKGPEFSSSSEINVNNLALSKIDIKKDVLLKGVIIGTKNKNLNVPIINNINSNMKVIVPGQVNMGNSQKNINIKGPNSQNVNMEGISPKIELPSGEANFNLNGNIPDDNIEGSKIDVNTPKFDVKREICKTNYNGSNVEINPDGVNINEPKINNNIDMNGKSYGMKIDVLNSNINSANINFKNSKKDILLKGVIRGIKKEEINLKGQNFNIKGDKINIPNVNNKEQKLNGKIGGNISIKGQNSNLRDRDFFLSGLIPSKNDKNRKIKIDSNKNKIKISGNESNINVNGDYNNLLYKKNKINFHGNLNDNNYLNGVDVKGSRRFKDIINENNTNNAHFEKNILLYEPIDINVNKNIDIQGTNNIGEREVNSGINFTKNTPTQLGIKTDVNNNLGININIDGGNDINLNNLGANYSNEEIKNDNFVMLSSENIGIKKKGKGLPIVGSKDNNFISYKIDKAGEFDKDKVNIENLKSANVGINGQKFGDKIMY